MLEMMMTGKRVPIGSGPFALFAGGLNTVAVATTEKYFYDTDIVNPSVTLANAAYENYAAANDVQAIIYSGFLANVLQVGWTNIAWAGDVKVTGTCAAAQSRRNGQAFGNNSVAIFAGGINAAESPATTSIKYTYSTRAITAGGAMGAAVRDGAAASTTAFGLMSGTIGTAGGVGRTARIYTHATDTTATSTNFTNTQYNGASMLTSLTKGVVQGGRTNATVYGGQTFTFADNTVANVTGLGLKKQYTAGASNGVTGVVGGGADDSGGGAGNMNTTDLYTHATDTIAPGTNLGVVRREPAACSSVNAALV